MKAKTYHVETRKLYVGMFIKKINNYYALVNDWRNYQVERKVFKDKDGYYIHRDSVKQYIEFPSNESEFQVTTMEGITFCRHVL